MNGTQPHSEEFAEQWRLFRCDMNDTSVSCLGDMNDTALNWCPVSTHPHWLQYPPVGSEVHNLLGGILLAVGTAGVLGNGLVLFVFTRFRRLRDPFSSFIVNLAVADMSTSLLHAMVVVSSFKERWVFGQTGCMFYACGVGFFGLLSIVTLSTIAVERYLVITAKPLSGNWKITQFGARKDLLSTWTSYVRSIEHVRLFLLICAVFPGFLCLYTTINYRITKLLQFLHLAVQNVCLLAWLYCLLMAAPPLFGWSRYGPEGFLTSCSWDYLTRSTNNRSYYIYLLTLGFVVPVCVIAYCYTFILVAIYAHSREMRGVKVVGHRGGATSMGGNSSAGNSLNRKSSSSKGSGQHRNNRRVRSTIRTAEIIIMLVALFLISWTPYAVVTLIGQFGDEKLITPWVASLPAFFAKASVVYNPIVYGLSHPHFRSSVKQYITTCKSGPQFGPYAASLAYRSRHVQAQQVPASPPVVHHHVHHVHFRCFPHRHPGATHFHSEPDHRGVTLLDHSQGNQVQQWKDEFKKTTAPEEEQAICVMHEEGDNIACETPPFLKKDSVVRVSEQEGEDL